VPIPVAMREAVGDRIYGCDDCQDACPPTVRLGRRHARALDGDVQAWVDVLDLLEADDHEVLDRFGRWYIAGREPRWLRRNALVVLGNTGDGSDARTRSVLARYRDGDDEMLAEHARWASDRLGLSATAAPFGRGRLTTPESPAS
jgi:epoxyqueuosine reductase